MIQRYHPDQHEEIAKDAYGEYVLFTDHQEIVGELLKALRSCRAMLAYHGHVGDTWQAADEAIRKAEGREP